MNIQDLINFAADFMSPGAAHAPTVQHHGVVSRHMKKTKGRTRPSLNIKDVKQGVGKEKIRFASENGFVADTSASDLASHHTWQEPSASDRTIINWRNKRSKERVLRRNMDPFESRMDAAKEVTGPCGCTLAIGDRVNVEGIGKGKITKRKERMLTVLLDNGIPRRVDQKFVHELRS